MDMRQRASVGVVGAASLITSTPWAMMTRGSYRRGNVAVMMACQPGMAQAPAAMPPYLLHPPHTHTPTPSHCVAYVRACVSVLHLQLLDGRDVLH